MIELKEVISVNRPIDHVFKFTSNFTFIEQWDPGVVSSVKLSQGPVGVGTEYELALCYGIFRLKMRYRIIEYEPPVKVVLEGMGKSFSATDTILFSPTESGTRIEYSARLYFSKLNAQFERVLAPLLTLYGKKAMTGLKNTFNHKIKQTPNAALFPSGSALPDFLADRAIFPGMIGFSQLGYRISKQLWKPNPELLTDKTVVITGATSGIGKAAALALAERDARLTLIARNRKKALITRQEIMDQTGNANVDFWVADLSLMTDIKRVAREIIRKKARVDVLINNAGALFNTPATTGEGFEKTFATDLLGVYFLTEQLLGVLSESSHPRIINVASGGMYTQRINVHDLQNRQGPYDGSKAYARAKRGMVILTMGWGKALEPKGFCVHAMHPGWVDTPGLAVSLPRFHRLTRPILRTTAQGADTIVWLASAREPGLSTGRFWLDRRPHEVHLFPGTLESKAERRLLWEQLTRLTANFK